MITIRATYGVLKVSEPHEPISGNYCRDKDPKWVAFCKEHKLKQGTDSMYKWYLLFLDLCANNLL